MRRLLVGTGRLAVVAKHFLELHLVKLFLPNHGARELLQVDARILYRFEEVDIELHSVLLVVHAFLENRLERMLKGLFEGRHTERWVVPSTYSSARPEPDQSPACWHHSSMISSLVALGPGHGRKHRH